MTYDPLSSSWMWAGPSNWGDMRSSRGQLAYVCAYVHVYGMQFFLYVGPQLASYIPYWSGWASKCGCMTGLYTSMKLSQI